jgi:hypothetical protein
MLRRTHANEKRYTGITTILWITIQLLITEYFLDPTHNYISWVKHSYLLFNSGSYGTLQNQ